MNSEPQKVAFLGLGHLGGPVCDALIASVHDVVVYDPRDEAVAPRVAAGARRAMDPADAARDADVIIVFVRDDAQATEALISPHGALGTARPDATVVMHSTIAPATVSALHDACASAGVHFLDVGVSRGGGRPADGLYLMCGGDAAAIDAVRPVLSVYGADVQRFGDVGAGMNAKLIRNAMRNAQWVVQHEGFALAEAAGLDLQAMAHLYRATFATSSDDEVVISRPSQLVGRRPSGPTDQLAGAVILGWKDFDDAFELAEEVDREIPMARAARRRYADALGVDIDEGDE